MLQVSAEHMYLTTLDRFGSLPVRGNTISSLPAFLCLRPPDLYPPYISTELLHCSAYSTYSTLSNYANAFQLAQLQFSSVKRFC